MIPGWSDDDFFWDLSKTWWYHGRWIPKKMPHRKRNHGGWPSWNFASCFLLHRNTLVKKRSLVGGARNHGILTDFPYIGNCNPNWLLYFAEGWLNHQPEVDHCWLMIPSGFIDHRYYPLSMRIIQFPGESQGIEALCLGIRLRLIMNQSLTNHDQPKPDYQYN